MRARVVVGLLLGCNPPPAVAPAAPADPAAAPVASNCEQGEGGCEGGAPAAEKPEAAAEAEAEAAAPEPAESEPPEAPLRPIATWPFHAWDRAEAITYNQVPYGPGISLRVYDADHGWSPKIEGRKPMTTEQAERAVSWVIAAGGEVEVSECAFPRHAVVLYSGRTPVGTANVCFECGDILVWPDLDPPAKGDETAAAAKEHARRYKKKLAAYDKVYPQWKRLFGEELGFSLAPPGR